MDDRYVRALDRAHVLADQWAGDPAPITRAEAAELLAEVLRLDGWTVSAPRPVLRAVPDPESFSGRLRAVPAVEAPDPRSTAYGPPEARPGPEVAPS